MDHKDASTVTETYLKKLKNYEISGKNASYKNEIVSERADIQQGKGIWWQDSEECC